jgi:S-adenosylmethionine synthetase
MSYLFTSESVSEGHPDKVCDFIADSVLDACLEQDPNSRVACEVLCKERDVVLAGEINSNALVDFEMVARRAIRAIGYHYDEHQFHADKVRVTDLLGRQSERIAGGVDRADRQLGAGDQGLVFGFATKETPELMPLPAILAHRITRTLAAHRHQGEVPFLRPDAKSQVTVRYEYNRPVEIAAIVVSTQHDGDTSQPTIHEYVREALLPVALGPWFNPQAKILVNPAGPFDLGGPEADCGVTGRKIIVDTYGGAARHGGGAFSGKDATKVDRSAAYFARYVARQIVLRGLAEVAEIQVAYAIGVPEPVSLRVDTRGTGDDLVAEQYAKRFDFRPSAIIEALKLDRPVFTATTNYGHFGRHGLEWEK